jgi:hypothetical protein
VRVLRTLTVPHASVLYSIKKRYIAGDREQGTGYREDKDKSLSEKPQRAKPKLRLRKFSDRL